MPADPLPSPVESVTGETDPPRPDRAVALRPVWRLSTVQCGDAVSVAKTVVAEAATIEGPCAPAIEEANGSDGWTSRDHCGNTLVDAVVEGNVDPPRTREGSVLPVPDRYTEAGEAPTIVVAVADGAVRDARIVGGSHPLSLVVITAADAAAARAPLAGVGRAPRLPSRFEPPGSEDVPTPARERTYRGHRDANGACHVVVVGADGRRRGLDPRLDLENKSPTGYEWGYAGSGPAQLALALCADALGDDRGALAVYQRFKFAVVARLDRSAPWLLTAAQVRERCAALRRERR